MTWINLLSVIYPVGSIYFSNTSTSPSSFVGGTWTQITNAVIRGYNGVGYEGSDTHTITISEMPNHNHGLSLNQGDTAAGLGIDWTWSSNATNFVYNGDNDICRNVGGGQAMSLLPRRYHCYIWYRTA